MTTTKVYILDRAEASGRGTNTPARFFNPTHDETAPMLRQASRHAPFDSFRLDAKRGEERGEAIGHGQQVIKELPWYGRNVRVSWATSHMSPHNVILFRKS